MIERIPSRVLALTPPSVRKGLRRLKLFILGRMSSASYWNFAARISPTAAILTDCTDEKEFYDTGKALAALTRRVGLLEIRPRVLNIGCGIGRFEQAIHAQIESAVGVDVSRRMVERARQEVQANNVRFELVDGRSLNGIASGEFDLCFSSYVFQHIPRAAVASYFQEAARVLKPGGHFLFQISVAGGPEYRQASQYGIRSDPPGRPSLRNTFLLGRGRSRVVGKGRSRHGRPL